MSRNSFSISGSVSLTSTTSTGRVVLPYNTDSPNTDKDVLVCNISNVPIFFKFGDNTVTADLTTSAVILPNTMASFSRRLETYAAAITTTGSGIVVFIVGFEN